ncbi:MAG: signal peptidase I [Henriciella sp.]|nr:signal peptidase I [Henriciella sp.]
MTTRVEKTTAGDARPRTLKEKAIKEAKEWGVTLSVFIPIFLIFSGMVYELRVIPSESMVPNLQVGDRVTVNKFAYGYSRHSLPFSLGRYIPLPEGRIFASQPRHGDVAVFEHPHTPRVMIKRIIGLPGDEIQMRGGVIFRNGAPVKREFVRRISYIEHSHKRRKTAREYVEGNDDTWLSHSFEGGGAYADTVTFIVPEGHFFFMGDNRDNSTDARNESGHCPRTDEGVIDQAGCPPRRGISARQASVGFVPFDNLLGRADTVLFSTYRCKSAQSDPCMKKRVWRGL